MSPIHSTLSFPAAGTHNDDGGAPVDLHRLVLATAVSPDRRGVVADQ